MATQDNLAAQERLAKAIDAGDLDAVVELFHPDVVDHDPAPGQPPGPEGFRAFFAALRSAFPDLAIEGDHVVAADETVAVAYTISGTHQGDFLGLPPTGRTMRARGVQVARFDEATIVERWGSTDEFGILRQLGATVVEPA